MSAIELCAATVKHYVSYLELREQRPIACLSSPLNVYAWDAEYDTSRTDT